MKDTLIKFQTFIQNQTVPIVIPRSEIQKLLVPAHQLRAAKFHIAMISFLLKLINLKLLFDV